MTLKQMATVKKYLKTCKQGHSYYKTSDCPTCPTCEKAKKPATGFLSNLSAPARRAMKNAGIISLQQLSGKSEKEILQLHGMGPASLPVLREALAASGMSFKK